MAVESPVRGTWERARAGDLRGAIDDAARALARCASGDTITHVELQLVFAFCAMRQGQHAEARRALDAAQLAAGLPGASPIAALRVAAWRAELAYFQGRYSAAEEQLDALIDRLEEHGDAAYAAFALRIHIAILLARADYGRIAAMGERALRLAQASGDDYVHVQILNILGAFHFDRATSKLPEHARSHLSSIEPNDTPPLLDEARVALVLFESAREVAERAHYDFAAWYVAGNIERLEILMGRAERAVKAIRKRLNELQARGARYDEIVARSNLAWGLRTLGQYREALRELDVALDLVRQTGAFNVLLEFLHYDRSVVLYALGDVPEARASYRRYLRLVGAASRTDASSAQLPGAAARRPLEPYFLKQADRLIVADAEHGTTVEALARHCGVSLRTLEKAFVEYRGITPVAHLRNLRLDAAHRVLEEGGASVAAVAQRFGFGSSTTFALEYRRRFGVPPSRTRKGRVTCTSP